MANVVLRAIGRSTGRQRPAAYAGGSKTDCFPPSAARGLLGEEQEEMIHGVFDCINVRVREIMVPWRRIVCLPLTRDVGALLDRIVEDRYSRNPNL